MRLCREKIKRGKAQIEFDSAAVVKDNLKNSSIKAPSVKGGFRRISILYSMQEKQ